MAYIIGIAIVLIILLIIIIGILVIPFQISMQLYREGSINQGHIKIKWIGIRFINRKIDIGPSKKQEKQKNKDETNKFDFERIPRMIRLFEESLPYIMNIFYAFLKSITIKRISLDSIIGFDSFVDTVKISGYLWAIAPMINLLPNTHFSVEPDFHKERIDGAFLFKLKIKLLPVASAFLKALTKKPFRSLLGELRKVRS